MFLEAPFSEKNGSTKPLELNCTEINWVRITNDAINDYSDESSRQNWVIRSIFREFHKPREQRDISSWKGRRSLDRFRFGERADVMMMMLNDDVKNAGLGRSSRCTMCKTPWRPHKGQAKSLNLNINRTVLTVIVNWANPVAAMLENIVFNIIFSPTFHIFWFRLFVDVYKLQPSAEVRCERNSS